MHTVTSMEMVSHHARAGSNRDGNVARRVQHIAWCMQCVAQDSYCLLHVASDSQHGVVHVASCTVRVATCMVHVTCCKVRRALPTIGQQSAAQNKC